MDAANDAKALDARMSKLFKAIPETMKGFGQIASSATADGKLSKRDKELMAVAIAVVTHCDDCILYHLRAAVKAGASRDHVVETLALAVEMGGGPAVVYGSRALEIYEGLQK